MEICRRLVGRQGHHYGELAGIFEERGDGLASHVRRNGHRIEVHCLEKRLCVHLGRVSYIATLGIGDKELLRVVRADIIHGLLQRQHTVPAVALVEREVRFICDAMRGSRIHYGLVELIKGTGSSAEHLSLNCYFTFVGQLLDVSRHLAEISVQTDAKH